MSQTPDLSPQEALTTAKALGCLDSAKARLRSGLTTQAAENLARRLTQYEDWLEYAHPRSPLRARFRTVRRQVEARLGGN